MAINKADFVGIENILDWYETNANNPYFSVWQGKLMKFGYNDEDKDKGKLLLADNLQAYQQGGHNEVLTLKLHPKKEKNGYITDKTPICASANFRVNELQSMGNIYPYISQQQQQPNDLILQKLNAVRCRIAAAKGRLQAKPLRQLCSAYFCAPNFSTAAVWFMASVESKLSGSLSVSNFSAAPYSFSALIARSRILLASTYNCSFCASVKVTCGPNTVIWSSSSCLGIIFVLKVA